MVKNYEKIIHFLNCSSLSINLKFSHFLLISSNMFFFYEYQNLYSFYKENFLKLYLKNKKDIIIPFQNYFMQSLNKSFNFKYYLDNGKFYKNNLINIFFVLIKRLRFVL